MSYEELSMRELQTECKTRGLHTGRSKGELINRLNADDREKSGAVEEPTEIYAEPEVPEATYVDGVLEVVYPLYGQPFTDELHMKLRLDTYLAALGRGYFVPAGIYAAWRIRSEGGNHTYGIRVRERTPNDS